jgi:teichoic acid transport system ATP-binding protein
MSTTQTVVLVSHSVGKIARLCSRALWLEQGEIIASGEPRIVIDKYQHYIDNAPIVAS